MQTNYTLHGLVKLSCQAEDSDEALCVSLTRVIRKPSSGAILPSRLFVSMSCDI